MENYAFSKSWFKKHQKGLIWFANSFLGRMVFRYGKMGLYKGKHHLEKGVPIRSISPNSISQYVFFQGRIQIREHFFVRREYALKLRFWFYPIWMAMHIWDLFADPFAPQLSFGFSTLTVNPDAGDPGTSTMDGQVSLDVAANTAWSTLHDAADGTTKDVTETVVRACRVDSDSNTDKWGTLIRSFFLYDITALPAGATISSNVHSTYGNTVTDQFGSQAIALIVTSPASNTTLALADFDQHGTTVQATNINFSSLSTGAYNDQTLNASGDTTVSNAYAGAKIVKFGIRLEADRANSPPTWQSLKLSEYKCNTADNASNKPKLVITYTTTTDYPLTAALGTFTFTGIAAGLTSIRTMIAALGTFTLTGIDAAFYIGKGIVADVGTFILTGVNATITSARSMVAAVGTFVLTGIDVGMGLALKLTAEVGQFILTLIDFVPKHWDNRTKPTDSGWTNDTKPTDSGWTNDTKPTDSGWTNKSK